MTPGNNSFDTLSALEVGDREYHYFSLEKLAAEVPAIEKLPYSLKVLLENVLRFEQGGEDGKGDVAAFGDWVETRSSQREIAFRPARVLMQDLTGVPAVVDLAAMRDAMTVLGGDPKRINPLVPVDLVIDHSVMVDYFGHADSFK
ncbi:MAG TPA: aconitase family protein, partial [Gammaproteobacteria bacterium]|nr:aconitase family protein [Gammaproteobacteria bacterium]